MIASSYFLACLFFGKKGKYRAIKGKLARSLSMKSQTIDESRSDAELLKAYTKGDTQAFDLLVARYQQALFSWFLGMTSNRTDAEDLFQEVWVRILRHADGFSDVSFRAWMWQIARNLLIDFRRKKKPDFSLDATDDTDDQPMINQLVSPSVGPAEALEWSDAAKLALQAVHQLPAVQREVFLMRVEGNLSFNEIAETLGIPLNTALGRMHDATSKLKKILSKGGVL